MNTVWWTLSAVVVGGLAIFGATALLDYAVSGRHAAKRKKLQQLVAEAVRDRGHGSFFCALSRDATSAEVQIDADGDGVAAFGKHLADRIACELPGTQITARPLEVNLDELEEGAVVVWNSARGQCFFARRAQGQHAV